MERRREELSASWEVPRQSRPIAASLRAGPRRAWPALTISFITKESFKPTLKCREGVCLPDPNCKMVLQEKSLIVEDSASHSTFGDSRTPK